VLLACAVEILLGGRNLLLVVGELRYVVKGCVREKERARQDVVEVCLLACAVEILLCGRNLRPVVSELRCVVKRCVREKEMFAIGDYDVGW